MRTDLVETRRLMMRLWYMKKLQGEPEEMERVEAETRELIDTVPNETLRKIAEARYIDCHTWKEVIDKLHYSKPTLERYNTLILKCISKQIW